MYVCTALAADGVTCTAWAETGPFGLPALSMGEAGAIVAAVGLLFAVAWAFKQARRV